ncbi:MAG: hypothetical protein K0R55_3064 [Sporomusa sp.]|nr:hypothetical protein [Sporomusa sp.]
MNIAKEACHQPETVFNKLMEEFSMSKIIALISLISLSVFISGCVSQTANQSQIKSINDNQSIVTKQPKDDKTTSTQQNGAATTTSTETTKSKHLQETFYGQWVIKKLLAFGPVGTYSNDDIKNIEGRKLSFSKESASCFGDQMKYLNDVAINPIYKKTVVSKSDFITGYRLNLDGIGIKSDSIIQINASDSKGNGCVFFIKDNDTLILVGGGAFFELAREM